jgi:hypothetical protein
MWYFNEKTNRFEYDNKLYLKDDGLYWIHDNSFCRKPSNIDYESLKNLLNVSK